jgi:spore germination protein KA
MKMIKKWFGQTAADSKQDHERLNRLDRTLQTGLADNFRDVHEAFGQSADVIIKEIQLGMQLGVKGGLIYIDGLADVVPLLQSLLPEGGAVDRGPGLSAEETLDYLKKAIIASGNIKDIYNFGELYDAIYAGKAVLLIEGSGRALAIEAVGAEKRGVEEPNTQSVIRGPREGFTETLRVNTSLVRRKIKDHRLWLENKQIGTVTKTDVAIMYIKGIANETVIQEVHSRLNTIEIDGILESGYIEELIQEKELTPFPTVYNTERPDTVASALLEGRVAIFVNGTPFVLIVPALFVQFFQAPEDYYQRADFATLLRLLRYGCFFIALLAPSMYIAITTYHQELLPTPLLISLAGQREGVPFPAFIEAIAMEITFEILREAGVRMPKTIGQSVSIVGTLVIGQAAVEAGLVSAAMVIVVSITAISNFVIPSFNMGISIRMLRLGFMTLAGTFGLVGVFSGLIALILHLCSLRSFGIPYMSPIAPFIPDDNKDTLFRLSWSKVRSRPHFLTSSNRKRKQPSDSKPQPDGRKGQ